MKTEGTMYMCVDCINRRFDHLLSEWYCIADECELDDWKGAMFICRNCSHRHFAKDTPIGWFCDVEECDYERMVL